LHHEPRDVQLVNGVGSVASTSRRQNVYDRFTREGYRFAAVVHPSAIVALEMQLGDGVQILAGAVLQPGSVIGSNAVINTGAIVDHDCALGAHVHISPRAVLSGGVRVGAGAHIGTGASVIQGISIGAGSIVGAGAVVVSDVPSGVTTLGVPAKVIHGCTTQNN
jgi:sugar O-acyltransferase (sialic acid O-acetyltransferase NeuD family)